MNQKVVPFGNAASLPTEPPIKLIKFLTIANPKPTPIFDLLLSDWSRKKRSNTLSLISDGIPVPLSSISYRTCDSKFLELIYISIPFSEDPYLISRMGTVAVRQMQQATPSERHSDDVFLATSQTTRHFVDTTRRKRCHCLT